MVSRTHPDNILWVCCCCGCLPIIGLVKGLITCGPVAAFAVIPCTFISLIMLPHDVFYTYYSVLKAKHLGPNITMLAMLLLPIPLFLWPVFVCLGSFLGFFFYGLGCPIVKTFNEDDNIVIGGIYESFRDTAKYIREFWHFNSHSYFVYLSDFRDSSAERWDISFLELIVALAVGLFAALVDGILTLIVACAYLGPLLLWGWYEMTYYYFKETLRGSAKYCFFMLFPFFLLGLALWPVAAFIVFALTILSGFCMGIACAYVCYDESVSQAMLYMCQLPCKVERYAVGILSERFNGNGDLCLLTCVDYFGQKYDRNVEEKREDSRRRREAAREKREEELKEVQIYHGDEIEARAKAIEERRKRAVSFDVDLESGTRPGDNDRGNSPGAGGGSGGGASADAAFERESAKVRANDDLSEEQKEAKVRELKRQREQLQQQLQKLEEEERKLAVGGQQNAAPELSYDAQLALAMKASAEDEHQRQLRATEAERLYYVQQGEAAKRSLEDQQNKESVTLTSRGAPAILNLPAKGGSASASVTPLYPSSAPVLVKKNTVTIHHHEDVNLDIDDADEIVAPGGAHCEEGGGG